MGNNWGKSQRLPSFLDNGMDEIIERVLWGKKYIYKLTIVIRQLNIIPCRMTVEPLLG